MQTIYQPDKPSPMLIAEIQYFMAFSAVKKLVALEKLTWQDAEKMNRLLAEQFGVRKYEIQKRRMIFNQVPSKTYSDYALLLQKWHP